MLGFIKKVIDKIDQTQLEKNTIDIYDIAQHFGINNQMVYKAFYELEWILKHQNNIIPTPVGEENGAHVVKTDNDRFVTWDRSILTNDAFVNKIRKIKNEETSSQIVQNKPVEDPIKTQQSDQAPQTTPTDNKTLTLKDIAAIKQIDVNLINNALYRLGWVEKSNTWTIATEEGKANGAIERYNPQTKTKFVIWEKSILDNQKLFDEIKSHNNSKPTAEKLIQKGQEYEEYIAKVFQARGYKVIENGKISGKKDGGIDLIVKNDREIIFIQCKNWNENGKYKITHTHIKEFRTNATDYYEKTPLFKSYDMKALFVLSGNFIDISAIKHIEEIQQKGKKIDYEIIKIDKNR